MKFGKKWIGFSCALLILIFQTGNAANIGLLVTATGRYIEFVPPLIESAQKYFCKGHNVTYFIFTDRAFDIPTNTIAIYQEKLGWPYDSLMRGHIYYKHRDLFISQDYLFACDADMLFVDDVGDEILGDHVATLHPGFNNQPGSYETNKMSNAFVKSGEGKHYFAGGFYGGSRDRFVEIVKTNAKNIDDDWSRGIIAVWHDESHWNRYCIDHEPSIILSSSYCFAYGYNLSCPKLIALEKDHDAYRK
jgi:histo-blood group ABO system transferase